jgi:iron complex outermembrane receptor protein
MKQIFCVAAFVCSTLLMHAQTSSGKVFDAVSHTPLAGATISSGGKNLTATDLEGKFTIDCSKTKRITVSFVGYETFHHSIKNCNEEISIPLAPASQQLNMVEITSISTNNKSLVYQPASISKLSTIDLRRSTGLFFDDAIHTNVPGVSMNRRSV